MSLHLQNKAYASPADRALQNANLVRQDGKESLKIIFKNTKRVNTLFEYGRRKQKRL